MTKRSWLAIILAGMAAITSVGAFALWNLFEPEYELVEAREFDGVTAAVLSGSNFATSPTVYRVVLYTDSGDLKSGDEVFRATEVQGIAVVWHEKHLIICASGGDIFFFRGFSSVDRNEERKVFLSYSMAECGK